MPSIINSDDGVSSGTSGLKTTGGNDGILALQNNGTTNVTVTAAGNVGVGTASPASKLHVTGLARICDPAAYILFRNAADSTSNGVVQFPDTGEASIVNYRNTDLTLGANNSTHARITAAGLFQFNSGYGSVATAYGCRAWVNFDGGASGTFAGGVSTVTRISGSTTATVTTTTAHGLITGNVVEALTGVAAGAYVVTFISATQFSFTTVATTALTAASITFAVNNIRASGNVSSVADNGTGDFTVNFTTAMPDANYSCVISPSNSSSPSSMAQIRSSTAPTASAIRFATVNASGSALNPDYINVAIFR